MGFEFLIPIFGILIVLVPIIGVTTVLTLRFGLKPFIETLAKELKGTTLSPDSHAELQIAALTEQVETLTDELQRLKEAQEFDSRLLEHHGGSVEQG
jgi:hypothetical protein